MAGPANKAHSLSVDIHRQPVISRRRATPTRRVLARGGRGLAAGARWYLQGGASRNTADTGIKSSLSAEAGCMMETLTSCRERLPMLMTALLCAR